MEVIYEFGQKEKKIIREVLEEMILKMRLSVSWLGFMEKRRKMEYCSLKHPFRNQKGAPKA